MIYVWSITFLYARLNSVIHLRVDTFLMQPKSNTPVVRNIPIINLQRQQQKIRAQIDQAITRVLDHGGYIMGPEVSALEAELAKFAKTKHAISCSSGTDALLLALMAKSLTPNDAVLLPSFTFSATAEVVALLQATPVFVDIDPKTFNVDINSIKQVYKQTVAAGLKPVGMISVDMFGQPCEYQEIQQWCEQNNIWLICDAAQSFGATYKGIPVGNFGDITTTSFYPSKPLGCYGDGGAVFTNNDILAEQIRSYRIHGEGSSKYDNLRVGLNARLDTIQAAILLEKMKIFPEDIAQRQALANFYNSKLEHIAITPQVTSYISSTWAQYTIQVPQLQRASLQAQLKEKGIGTCVYYPIPLHKQPAYQSYAKLIDSQLSVSEELSSTVLSLPMGCDMDSASYICDTLQELLPVYSIR